MKKIKIISALIIPILFLMNFSFADLSALWFTKNLNVSVGDTVKIDLYLNPDIDHPIVTVSNTLNYDQTKLKFVSAAFPDNWIVLPEAPEFVTDEASGFLRRTGGVAGGVSTNVKYLTYTFKATKPGDAQIFIEDGKILDEQNTDLGFPKKQMTIHIRPATVLANTNTKTNSKIATSTVSTTTLAALSVQLPKIATFQMEVLGKTAILEGQDYNFSVNIDKTNTDDKSGTAKLNLFNSENQSIFTQTQNFDSTQNQIKFTIPANNLSAGDFVLKIVTSYNGTGDTVTSEKDIGVVESNITWFDKNKYEFFFIFAIFVFLAFLYHLFRDHKYVKHIQSTFVPENDPFRIVIGEKHFNSVKVDHKPDNKTLRKYF